VPRNLLVRLDEHAQLVLICGQELQHDVDCKPGVDHQVVYPPAHGLAQEAHTHGDDEGGIDDERAEREVPHLLPGAVRLDDVAAGLGG